MNDALAFLREFVKHPTKVGAIAPSSQSLAREIVQQARVPSAQVIVEFGSGTGVFTGEIVAQAPQGSTFIAIEINPEFAEILRQKYPRTNVYNVSAEKLPEILAEHNLERVDSIVCGLPWAAFGDELQDSLLGAAYDSLKPGGVFATFAYLQGLLLPAGMKFSRKISAKFSSVKKSRILWRNLPPAFVYVCQK